MPTPRPSPGTPGYDLAAGRGAAVSSLDRDFARLERLGLIERYLPEA